MNQIKLKKKNDKSNVLNFRIRIESKNKDNF